MSLPNARFLNTQRSIAMEVPRIKDFYARMINNIMFECSQIKGGYSFHSDEYTTTLVIQPISSEFDKKRRSKLLRHKEIYINIYEFVLKQHPYCIDE